MITDDEVMLLFERADPARSADLAPIVDAAGDLAALRTRSINVNLIDLEPAPIRPRTGRRRLLAMAAAAAVVAILIGALVLAGQSHSNDHQIPTATTAAPDTATPQTAAQIASRFIEARNAWDGTTVRSLVADDAVISDFSVTTADDYLAKSEFERIVGWRFLQPQCTTTELGPPTTVSCTYTMQDNLSEALHVGPITGNRFEFVVRDGRIEEVSHRVYTSKWYPEVFQVFADWLTANHPGDIDVMFKVDINGWTPIVTPQAFDLLAQHEVKRPGFHRGSVVCVFAGVAEMV